jgi:hypothetical protein
LENCNIIYNLIPDNATPEQVVDVLLQNHLINTTALQELRICYKFRDNLRKTGRKMTAVIDTAIDEKCSTRKVYNARKKFD